MKKMNNEKKNKKKSKQILFTIYKLDNLVNKYLFNNHLKNHLYN